MAFHPRSPPPAPSDPDGAAVASHLPGFNDLFDLELDAAWRLADLLLLDEMPALERLFHMSGLAAPHIRWGPTLESLHPQELRDLWELWSDQCRADLLPSSHSIDVDWLGGRESYFMALDVLANGEDFRYRLYGPRIAAVTGFNMTGKLLSAVPTRSTLAAFFLASYRAVVLSKSPLLTIHRAPSYPIDWTRLILPLVDAGGAVTRILAGNIPHDRTPRVSDPRS